jgi:DNA-binding IclR family transcriptional regulator
MEKILSLLRAHPSGITSVEIAQSLGWSRAAVAATLRSMKRAALIQGAGMHRDGAAVVQLRTRPLQLNISRRPQRRSRVRVQAQIH